MTTRVVTYIDPLALESHRGFMELQEYVHICATPSLRLGMQWHYRDLDLSMIAFKDMADVLFAGWRAGSTMLSQYATLTQINREFKAKGVATPERMRAFRRNQQEVLRSIRQLVEAGLDPSQLRPTKDQGDLKLFQLLWQELETRDPRFAWVRTQLYTTFTQNTAAFMESLESAVAAAQVNCETPRRELGRKLVFHGFYFITPLQYQMFRLCEQAGFELVYLNCYDLRYPKLFATWEAFFNSSNGLPDKQDWQQPVRCGTPPTAAQLFAELMEGRPAPQGLKDPRLTVKRYDDFGAFVLQFQPDGAYFSPEADALNRFLEEYYPPDATKQRRHVLAYPVGQLLLHLHRLWDEEDGVLKLTEKSLFECFASGWLRSPGGRVSKQYLRALEKLLPFFGRCETLADWQARTGELRAIRTGVVRKFDTPVAKEHSNHRFHQFLHNPLERFAHFSVTDEELDGVIDLMTHLFTVADTLFGNRKVSIGGHLAQLQKLLMEPSAGSELYDEEQKLLQDLRQRIASTATAQDDFFPEDLAEAITLFLGGKLAPDDDDLDGNRQVSPFDRLDGAPLSHGASELHLCLLGERSLPNLKGSLPWPITPESLVHLEHLEPVRMIRLRAEQSVNADRYLFYYTLAWGQRITLSWITNWQDDVLNPSPYVTLVQGAATQTDLALPLWDPSAPRPPVQVTRAPITKLSAFETYPPDALAEANLCQRRFLYSFLAQRAPSFSDPFHHEFLFGSLVKALAQASGRSDVEAQVSELFPQWLPLVKRFRAEDAPAPWSGYSDYDGEEYQKARHTLSLVPFYANELKPAREVLGSERAQQAVVAALEAALTARDGVLPANPGSGCRYCPHTSYCTAAQFALDDDQEENQ